MINAKALHAVEAGDNQVNLIYQCDSDTELRDDIERLVEAEQGCCGAAGVEFSSTVDANTIRVSVRATRVGLPSATVLNAFAAMTPKNH